LSKRLIDVETGEDLTSDYRIIHRNTAEAYKRKIEREQAQATSAGKRWVASYHDPIREIIADMSLTEAGAIIKLLPYLRFKSNGKLIDRGKPMKQADIQRVFKRGKKATREILNRLQELGVISVLKEGRTNTYYINAEFHGMGSVREGASFTKVYQAATRELVKDLDLAETGLLYKILPFFHYSEYYLCDNPDEENPEVIRHLNREQLAERIGHDEKTVFEAVSKLQRKGAILTTKSGKTVRYLVHPDIMFRQPHETEWTQSVRKLFEQHNRTRT